jgi:signal transduction histidine kinase
MSDIQPSHKKAPVAKTNPDTAFDETGSASPSTRRLALAIATIMGGWAVVIYLSLPLPAWQRLGLGLVSAAVVCGLVHLEKECALLAQRLAERSAELSAANAKLAQVTRLKDEFLANTSHELRTPLNTILGLSEVLQEQIYGPLNEKQLQTVHNVAQSGHHLLDLVNAILDLSKIRAGKLELYVSPTSVEATCRAALRLIAGAAQDKGLKVSLTLDDTEMVLQADEQRLRQILLGLLSNAVKFTPKGGAIGLDVVGDAGQNLVHFSVWDTGIGISQRDMARLFQPFEQLDGGLSRRYPGAGLGLALVSCLTEMHNGRVSVQSQVGQGSRFTVSLPWRTTF